MKKFTLLFVAVIFIIASIFQSCSTSNDVVSSSFIQKRKYQKGFLVNVHNKQLKKIERVEDVNFVENGKVTNSSDKKEDIKNVSASTEDDLNIIAESKQSTNPIDLKIKENEQSNSKVVAPVIANKKLKAIKQILKAQSPNQTKGDGLAMAGFIMGLLSFITLWFSPISLLFGLLAIIFSAISMRSADHKWLATVGLILGILTFVIFLALIILIAAIFL